MSQEIDFLAIVARSTRSYLKRTEVLSQEIEIANSFPPNDSQNYLVFWYNLI
jgi:hypothetical protein